jgi:hypothetical protein
MGDVDGLMSLDGCYQRRQLLTMRAVSSGLDRR